MSQKVIIVFGGKSGEHEVSVNSALSVAQNIDRVKFDVSFIGIAHSGSWNFAQKIEDVIKDGRVVSGNDLTLPGNEVINKMMAADVIFPILHGPNGEDGTIQGLFELANVAYVGAGVLSSAMSMDKAIHKQLCSYAGIPQVKYLFFTRTEWESDKSRQLSAIGEKLQYPLFVKPANMGSSVGVSKVKTAAELEDAILKAFKFDNKVIVEQGLEGILEVEISVMGNDHPQASSPGSIVPNTEFYDYETKYLTDDIKANIPAQIPGEAIEAIKQTALHAYQLMNCAGLARIDFFFEPNSGQHYLSELNTLPGFTKISMYPKMWEASGLSYRDLITKLIELAQDRFAQKQKLQYQYQEGD